MANRTVAIVQARMTSNRLPGKSMMMLGDKPTLQRVLERAQRIRNIDGIILAVPDTKASAPMIELAHRMRIGTFLGSELDVLSRYHAAAVSASAAVILRITADCPLLDPYICDQVIELRKGAQADYASNCHPRSFPQGLDCECFTFEALKKAHHFANDPYEREHVTPYIIRNSQRLNLASGRFDLAEMNWCLDTREDLKFLKKVFAFADPQTMQHTLDVIDSYIREDAA